MHSKARKTLWFKILLMVDTTELHFWKLVKVTLTLITGPRAAKMQELLRLPSYKVHDRFRWNLVCS